MLQKSGLWCPLGSNGPVWLLSYHFGHAMGANKASPGHPKGPPRQNSGQRSPQNQMQKVTLAARVTPPFFGPLTLATGVMKAAPKRSHWGAIWRSSGPLCEPLGHIWGPKGDQKGAPRPRSGCFGGVPGIVESSCHAF